MRLGAYSRLLTVAGVLVCGSVLAASNSLELVEGPHAQRVFGGNDRGVEVRFHNGSAQRTKTELRTRLYQTGGAVAALFGETPWKELELLAGQTVVESARLNFPQTRGETLFLVQWITETDQVVGATEVWVYPTNLLEQLKPFAAGEVIGVLDPGNRLKTALTGAGLDCVDLETSGLERFGGKLAIVVSDVSAPASAARMAASLKELAERGTLVVWIQETTGKSFSRPTMIFPQGKGVVAVVSAESIRALGDDPVAQLHLVGVIRMAARPEFWMAGTPRN